MGGKVLSWFSLYHRGRSQRFVIGGVTSRKFQPNCGVPQGSCVGPILYNIYTSSLFEVLDRHSVDTHCYAHESQLYLSFSPSSSLSQKTVVKTMENWKADIRRWA